MEQNSFVAIIKDQTNRALWEVHNVIDCIPDHYWSKNYCDMPLWKHVYHTLHSLDQWFINPRDPDYEDPPCHEDQLNNLDVVSLTSLSRADIQKYYDAIRHKITDYIDQLTDEQLLKYPDGCEYTRFTLILAQFRHLHTHMGIIMGFIIDDTGLWPNVVGLERPIPTGDYKRFF